MTRINTSSPEEFGKGDVITGPNSEAVERSNGFTPGPWFIHPMGYGFDVTVQGISKGSYGGWILEVSGGVRDDDPQEFKAEYAANIRLISAAPDLLVALQAVLKDYEQLIDSGDCGHCSPASEAHEVIAARAAIAKALGQ